MWRRLLARIYPNYIYKIPKEMIDDELISLALKEKLSLTKDNNDVLRSNYNYIVKLFENSQIEELDYIINFGHIDYSIFSDNEINDIAMKIYEKNNDLLIDLLLLNEDIIVRLNYDNFKFDFDSDKVKQLNQVVYDNLSFDDIPVGLLKNNNDLCRKYLDNDDIIKNRIKLIENCPNLKDEINKSYFKVILKNIGKNIDLLYDESMKKLLLQSDNETKNDVLKALIENNKEINYFHDVYRENIVYLKYIILKNSAILNEIDLKLLEKLFTGNEYSDLLKKYVNNSNINKEVIEKLVYMIFDKALMSEEENQKLVVELYTKGYIEMNDRYATLVDVYPIEFLKTNIQNIRYCKKSYSKDTNDKIIDLLKENNFSYTNDLNAYFDANDIFRDKNLFIKALSANLISIETFNAGFTILGFSKKDLKEICDYLQKNMKNDILNYIIPLVKKILCINNYELDTVLKNTDLIYDMDSSNKSKVIELLKQIKTKDDITGQIILRMPKIDKELIKEAYEVLGDRIKINPTTNQNSGELKYEVRDIIKKDKLLQSYVETFKDKIMPNGDIKKLSPYEKYVGVYWIVANYKKFLLTMDTDYCRAVYEVIDSNNPYIVCAGYVNLMKEMLERIGLNECFDWHAIGRENIPGENTHHARLVIHLKDEKYGIDGVYMADPTWDNLEGNKFNYINMTKDDALKDTTRFEDDVHLGFHEEQYQKLSKVVNLANMPIGNKSDFFEVVFNRPIPKEATIKAMLAIERFTDKNMPMVKENIVGENGYSKEEYNEVAARYFYKFDKSVFIDFSNDLKKACDEIIWQEFSNPSTLSHYNMLIRNFSLGKFINSISAPDSNVQYNLLRAGDWMVLSYPEFSDLEQYVDDIKEKFPDIICKFDDTMIGNSIMINLDSLIDKNKPLNKSRDKVIEVIEFINNINNKVNNSK